MPSFHLAFPVTSLEKTKDFYLDILGCTLGRTDTRWVDINFFGHQISAHLIDTPLETLAHNDVDHDQIPVRHFGVILAWDQWLAMQQRLKERSYPFFLEPKIRFQGEAGEQGTFFIQDPCGNCLEFKSFQNPEMLFATTL